MADPEGGLDPEGADGFKVPPVSLGLRLHHHGHSPSQKPPEDREGKVSGHPGEEHGITASLETAVFEPKGDDKEKLSLMDTHVAVAPEMPVTTATEFIPTEESTTAGVPSAGEEPVLKSDDNENDTSDEPSSPSQASNVPVESKEPLTQPPLPYTEPHWSGTPTEAFSLTVIKNGTVIQEISITEKAYLVFGRLPVCSVPLEHPSISRYHAILQCRPTSSESDSKGTSFVDNVTLFSTNPKEAGFYVYDLGSTHGTYLNKTRIQSRCYYRVRVGQMIKFGGSSRLFVLEHGGLGGGGQEEVEEEAERERGMIERQKEEWKQRQAIAMQDRERERQRKEEIGATWGMVLDEIAPHGEDSGEEMDVDPEKEAFYKEDPKKALKKFFDREGLELEYETEEEGPLHARTYTVRVRLPIDTATGEPVYAEASVKGRKKEAVIQCALDACRMLDAQDILRNPIHAHKRRMKNWEEMDYYDSDEDTFLDRTGEIEQKRKRRMKKAGKVEESVESYKTLQNKLSEIQQEIQSLEETINKAKEADSAQESVESLDLYMKNIGSQLDKGRKAEIKHRLHELRKEEEKVEKLMKIAKPAELPSVSRELPADEAKKRSKQGPQRPKPPPYKLRPNPAKHMSSSSIGIEPTSVSCGDSERPLAVETGRDSSKGELAVDGQSDKECGTSVGSHSAPYQGSEVPTNKRKPSSSSTSPHPPTKKVRLVGPTLPPQLRKQLVSQEKKGSKDKALKDKLEENDPDFSPWLPPADQTGDGRTYLNEKFGY